MNNYITQTDLDALSLSNTQQLKDSALNKIIDQLVLPGFTSNSDTNGLTVKLTDPINYTSLFEDTQAVEPSDLHMYEHYNKTSNSLNLKLLLCNSANLDNSQPTTILSPEANNEALDLLITNQTFCRDLKSSNLFSDISDSNTFSANFDAVSD